MAVKKVNPSIDQFIRKGADVKASKDLEHKNVLIRMPISILDAIDKIIDKTPRLTRTKWIIESLYKEIDDVRGMR